ncbi:hypothetical protein F4779DRAFT_511446 [Xylariaceae sp. FL0662B]|nr:hypothetical protein F4779DRAFT_511446 [Xylariaceae sp. FL0662B]
METYLTLAKGEQPNRMNLGLPFRQCSGPHCMQRQNLLRCGACQVAPYCGAEHQKAHRSAHKTSCNLIKKAREAYEREKAALEAHPGDIMTPANPFEEGKGHFWGLHGTRPYMRQYFELMSATLNIRTGEAVETALKYGLDMLRLNRGDNQGVREQIPALYLRLGRDQEAYDFLKWYAVGATSTYDWHDMDLPFLNLRGEDAFEDYLALSEEVISTSFIACMTNLKIRLLIDVRGLQDEVRKHPGISYEKKIEWVREEAISDVLYDRRDIVDREDYKDLLASLQEQVANLYDRVNELNQYYWPALDHPEQYSHATPTMYTMGSPEEVILAFRHTWYSWAECPQALDFAKKLKA